MPAGSYLRATGSADALNKVSYASLRSLWIPTLQNFFEVFFTNIQILDVDRMQAKGSEQGHPVLRTLYLWSIDHLEGLEIFETTLLKLFSVMVYEIIWISILFC